MPSMLGWSGHHHLTMWRSRDQISRVCSVRRLLLGYLVVVRVVVICGLEWIEKVNGNGQKKSQ